jgi:hypothetical protein
MGAELCSNIQTSDPTATVIRYYILGFIDISSFILSFVCVACIGLILFKRNNGINSGNIFKFFMVKAICDFGYFSIDVFSMKFFCGKFLFLK